jgi:uncharacterized protein YndB with AHSA1/START domain
MGAIEVDQFVGRPVQQVWQALTDPDLLARWLMPNDFKPDVGHQFTFRTEPVPQHGFDGIVHCQVLALDPPQLLRISWRGGTLDTTVTWRLVPEGTGTRLLISHDGFDDTDPAQQAAMRILGGGWRGHLAGRILSVLGDAAHQGGAHEDGG